MSILHVKSPNGSRTDIDLSKIVNTDTNQTITGLKTFDRIKFDSFGEIGSRSTDHKDTSPFPQMLISANRIVDAWTYGGVIRLEPYDSNNSDRANGGFYITVEKDTGGSSLEGLPNGNLNFKGNRIDIDSMGDNWIRYGNGIQICWGGAGYYSRDTVFYYPQPFISLPHIGMDNGMCNLSNWTNTSFTMGQAFNVSFDGAYLTYFAIGYWK